MKSMTGYAFYARQDADTSFTLEIKGYNNRFLDISVYMPPILSALEPDIRGYMASRFSRGKIEVLVKFKEFNAPISVTLNREAAHAYWQAVAQLGEDLGLDEKPSLSFLLGMEGVLEIERARDDERYRGLIEPALKITADQFEAERLREGKRTEDDILAHIGELEDLTRKISGQVPALEAS